MLPSSPRFDDSRHEALQQPTSAEKALTREELILLTILRTAREHTLEMFTDRELARLRFVRWLVETGRLSR